MFQGANTLECESSRERKFPGQFAPGNESSGEREGQGAKGPGSESSRELIGHGPIGRFAPGSELARERKGCESELGTRKWAYGYLQNILYCDICYYGKRHA